MTSDVIAPNRFREERIAAGIGTPDGLAERAGIAPSAYRAIEDGRILPSQPEFQRLREALGGIDYASPVASAQVKSAILLAGLYADGESRVAEPAW